MLKKVFFEQATFESLESQLKEVSNNIDALARNYYELMEMRHVLKLSQDFFYDVSTISEKQRFETFQLKFFL